MSETTETNYAKAPERIRRVAERVAKDFSFDTAALEGAICAALVMERERWEDKVDGLEADLDSAIERLWAAGATTWVKLNYPKHFARYSEKTQAIRSSHD